MPVNEALLEQHGSLESARLGISEQYLRLNVGDGWTVGILSRPLGRQRPLGWVISHSFGPEQMELQMTEVFLARGLARAGFPVLRFQCQGYGDSESMESSPHFSSHVRDTTDAVRHMQEVAGVREVGLIGARFGGTVAAVVADRLNLPHLVLIAPAVSGRRFATELLRVFRISEMAGDGSTRRSEDPQKSLEAGRAINVKGFMLSREMIEEMRSVDLLSLVNRFDGRALVVQASLGEKPQPAFARLVDHLAGLGASVAFKVVTDPFAPRFGSEHMRFVDTNLLKDMLTDLNESLLDSLLEWGEGAGQDPMPTNGGAR